MKYSTSTVHKFTIEKEELEEMVKFYYTSQGFKWPIGTESYHVIGDSIYYYITEENNT